MERAQATSRRQADNDVAAPPWRFAVIVGKPADDGSARRVEEPDRLLRVWSLLQATYQELDRAALPPQGLPRLQHQLRAVRHDLEEAVSPPLAAELRRILPPEDGAPSAGALRIECAALMNWTSSLVIQMLGALAAARQRLSPPSAAA